MSERDAVKVTPDRDPNIHPTVYVPRKQTDYTASQYTVCGRRIEGEIRGRRGRGVGEVGGTETRCKQRIRRSNRIINNMNLKSLKKGEKCGAECKGKASAFFTPNATRASRIQGLLNIGDFQVRTFAKTESGCLVLVRYSSRPQIVLKCILDIFQSGVTQHFSACTGREREEGTGGGVWLAAPHWLLDGPVKVPQNPKNCCLNLAFASLEWRHEQIPPAMLASFHCVCCLAGFAVCSAVFQTSLKMTSEKQAAATPRADRNSKIVH